MTIRETVKQALTAMPGNKPFNALDLIAFYPNCECENDTPSQRVTRITSIKRALRDIPYVRKLADGRYVVKGRRVPTESAPKLVKIVQCNTCHKFATRNSQIDQELGICGRCAQTKDRRAAKKAQPIGVEEIAPFDRVHYAALADKYKCTNCGTLSNSLINGLCWRCQPVDITKVENGVTIG